LFPGSAIIVASAQPEIRLRPEETVWIDFEQDWLHLFDGVTKRSSRVA
jgi:hypothetical protein